MAPAPRICKTALSHIASNLFEVQARFGYLSAQSVNGPSPLLTSDRGPQADVNAIVLPHGQHERMIGANDVGGKTTWNLAGLKNMGCLRAGGGVLYSQIGVLASCNGTRLGAETRIYDLRHPTFDIYGNLNLAQWAQVFFGERDTTRSDRRTVYGLQLNF